MKIDDRELTQEVLKALSEMAHNVPDDVILALGHLDSGFFRGFRVKQSNLTKMREIISQRIQTEKHLSPTLRMLLQRVPLHEGVVKLLANDFLFSNLEDLALAFGETDFLAALLVSDDENIRKLAWDYIDSDPMPANQSRLVKATQLVRLVLHPLYEKYLDLFPQSPPETKADSKDTASSSALSEALKQLELAREKLQKERSEHHEVIVQHTAEAEKLKEQVRRLRAQLEQANSASESLRNELGSQNAEIETRAAELADRSFTESVRPWLAHAQDTEKARSSSSPDLIAATRDLLEKQQERDRHFGNRVYLSKQRDEFSNLLEEVENARRSALSPLPELATAESRIRAELARLDARLGYVIDAPTFLSPIMTAINSKDSLDKIAEIRSLIDRSVEAGIYDESSVGDCYRAMYDKSVQLLDFASQQQHRSPPSPAELFLMQLSVSEGSRILFIDGHNVLFLLKDVLSPYLDQKGIPGSSARNVLIESISGVSELAKSLNIRLYFDGVESNQDSFNDYFKIIYSGGTGANRADNAILKDLAYYAQKGNYSIFIITRDMDLASKAFSHGAGRIDPIELSGLIATKGHAQRQV